MGKDTDFERTQGFAAFTEQMKRIIRVPKKTLDERLKADREAAKKSGRSKMKQPR